MKTFNKLQKEIKDVGILEELIVLMDKKFSDAKLESSEKIKEL